MDKGKNIVQSSEPDMSNPIPLLDFFSPCAPPLPNCPLFDGTTDAFDFFELHERAMSDPLYLHKLRIFEFQFILKEPALLWYYSLNPISYTSWNKFKGDFISLCMLEQSKLASKTFPILGGQVPMGVQIPPPISSFRACRGVLVSNPILLPEDQGHTSRETGSRKRKETNQETTSTRAPPSPSPLTNLVITRAMSNLAIPIRPPPPPVVVVPEDPIDLELTLGPPSKPK